GDDQFLHGSAGARFPRGTQGTGDETWRAPRHRRDAHRFLRPRRLYRGQRARSGYLRRRQMRGGRDAHRRLGAEAEDCRGLSLLQRRPALGPFGHGHHAFGQSDAVRLPSSDTGRGDDGQGLCPYGEGRRKALNRPETGDRDPRGALARRPRRRAGGVHLRARPAQERHRGRDGPYARGGGGAAHGAPEPRLPDRTVPQHDACEPIDEEAADRPPRYGLRRNPDRTFRVRTAMLDTPCPSGATLAEAEAFLADNPDVEAIDIVLHDSNG